MPATGRKQGVRSQKSAVRIAAALLLAAAGALWADEPGDPISQAAAALGRGDAAGFGAAFDPSTPGLAQIRADATELIREADAQSNIEFRTDTGDRRAHSLQLNWGLRIVAKNTAQGTIRRQAQVVCRVAQRNGQWRIIGFEPYDFFRPPHVDGAWNVLESAASALAAGSANEFLAYFDRSMPGYAELATGAAALVTQGEVQSSIELVTNDGSDVSRTIEVDWVLQVVAEDTTIHRGVREQRVKCRLDLLGKKWRITATEPVSFFSVISLGAP
ncbi:MAG TPA: hypothetical protein VKB88_08460 [Bryobacteraceae bacterium]|nr:hypothetical protein [Bryobacteraceae bacterium]